VWPPRVSDVVSGVCFLIAGGLIYLDRWPFVVALAVVVGIFSAL
jgi:hypothetical protein